MAIMENGIQVKKCCILYKLHILFPSQALYMQVLEHI